MRPEMIKTLVEKLAKYYGCQVTAVDYEFWLMAFDCDITEDEFKSAARSLIRSEARFMPKAGDLYQSVMKSREDARLQGLPTVAAGVAEIRDSLGEYDRAPKYSHPVLDRAVQLLGYWNLGHMPSDEVQRAIGTAYGEIRKNFIAGKEPEVDQTLIDWKRVREIGEGNGR